MLSPQLPSPGRREGRRDDGGGGSPGDARERPGAESVPYLKAEAALPPAPQDRSYLPKGKVANTDVTLQALPRTKVAAKGAPGAPARSRQPALGPGADPAPPAAAAAADPAHGAEPGAGELVGLARPPPRPRGRLAEDARGPRVAASVGGRGPAHPEGGERRAAPGRPEARQAASRQRPSRRRLRLSGAAALRPEAGRHPGAPRGPVAPPRGAAPSGPRLRALPEPLLRGGLRPVQGRQREAPECLPGGGRTQGRGALPAQV